MDRPNTDIDSSNHDIRDIMDYNNADNGNLATLDKDMVLAKGRQPFPTLMGNSGAPSLMFGKVKPSGVGRVKLPPVQPRTGLQTLTNSEHSNYNTPAAVNILLTNDRPKKRVIDPSEGMLMPSLTGTIEDQDEKEQEAKEL